MKKIKVTLIKNQFLINKESYQSLSTKGFSNKNKDDYFLDIYEAMYLLEKDKIEIFDYKNNKIFPQIIKSNKIFQIDEYLVYKDLKSKGYNIKSGLKFGFSFRVYDKGIKPGEDHSLWLVEVLNEKDKINIKNLISKNRISNTANKKMLFAIIDFENDITYIQNSWKRV